MSQRLTPISRANFVRRLRNLGFEGPAGELLPS